MKIIITNNDKQAKKYQYQRDAADNAARLNAQYQVEGNVEFAFRVCAFNNGYFGITMLRDYDNTLLFVGYVA